MNLIDSGVILVFTILVLGCGLSFSRSGKSMNSFYAAGGALPWWMSGLSLFMSFFSSGTFVTWGSIAYSQGFVAITIQWTMAIAGILVGLYIAPRWNRTKALTASEYIRDRLGVRVQKTYTYILLLIGSFSTGAFLYPVAKIVEVSTGIPLSLSIAILGLVILAYTAVGGLWAVIVTDILQFVVLTAAVIIVVPLALDRVGGVSGFLAQAPPELFAPVSGDYTWTFIVVFGLYNLFFIAGNWPYVQRYTSVATPEDAKKVGLLFGGLYFISPLIWMLPPMVYRVLNPDLTGLADEGAYLLICKEILPVGMLGLMLGAMIFATSSSVNTAINLFSGVIANDIYKNIRPSASDRALVRVGRLATVALGLITIAVALFIPKMGGIVSFVFTIAAMTGGALFLPPVWALFSKYQTGAMLLSVSLFTLAVNAVFKFVVPALWGMSLNREQETLLGIGLPVLLLAVSELMARHRGLEAPQYQKYKVLEQAKHEAAASVSQSQHQADNRHGLRVIAAGVFAIGLIMLALSVIAEASAILVAAIAGLIIALGVAMYFRQRQNKDVWSK
ncbi:Na+:solute symporter [Gilvimarinus agarilyticus]|uniref:sodium:solute symporter family protein n=1 Tax=Gilvimarinus sp. 2_MG-2023 TaxID=3062666 RepID=UPI001C097B5F|nr:sodium:solute symporter family protein [Gilvimarinus sp. 2_MG-2023]MBU2887738.1 Na+:solute symporter [Gilvimarinus agarilyticus]MDO6572386.1 sodium:solute symporter family protein [Gilvimarinus sp. 2_MG-2023]